MTRLAPGYYGALQDYPFHNPMRGGMDWSMDGRACGKLVGWFAVDQVQYLDDELVHIELRFEQWCDGAVVPLRGWIRWGSGLPVSTSTGPASATAPGGR